jgi:tRNA (cytidine/uridine-2'-O-)-methyltransferase
VHIVLVEPQIPGNTGNIARLCAANGCELHLVKPLGFSTQDRDLKRAGLDYWPLVRVHYHDSVWEILKERPADSLHLLTTKARRRHSDAVYKQDDFLLFGKETAGLPKEVLAAYPGRLIRIPMKEDARSLNLANAVAVVVYEALRQNDYEGLM